MTISNEIKKHVLNKKIVGLKLNKFRTGVKHHPFTFDPVFELKGGTKIKFMVMETEVGEYGIEPIIIPATTTTKGQ